MRHLSGGMCIRGFACSDELVSSGAIFGIAGLLLCIVLLSKGHFEEITLRQLIFMSFSTLYHGFAESGVNNCAHIVGAIIGFVCGIIIFCQMKKRKAEGM